MEYSTRSAKDRQEEELQRGNAARDEEIIQLKRVVRELQEERVNAIEARPRHAEELSAAMAAELDVARDFLSTRDRLSGADVLAIVRDLNENIFQVAVELADEWGELERVTGGMDALTFRPRSPAFTQLVCNLDCAALTNLLQSSLCSQVVAITSSWGCSKELNILESVYQQLSASGELLVVDYGQA